MKNLEIRIISGEVYVPLHAVVELLKQANPLANIALAQQAAIKHQAASLQQGVGLGQVVGGVLHPECGDNQAQFIPHEQDYRGLSR